MGFIGYKHDSKALKHDDGINNVGKHASRTKSDSVKWREKRKKKIYMVVKYKYHVL